MMKYRAVITGDIVHSRKIGDLHLLLSGLKACIEETSGSLGIRIQFEIFRGDSFQMVTDQPEDVMKIALIIRARLKSLSLGESEDDKNIPLDKLWDARVSMGIGEAGTLLQRVTESTGQAFELSGKQLDEMKNSGERMRLITCWNDLNEQFAVITSLSDAIINRWTYNSSEAVYHYLLYGKTQVQISEKLGISQPAVHNRLSISNIDAIVKMLNYLNKTIKSRTDGN